MLKPVYQVLWLNHRFERWLGNHFTPRGQVVLTGMVGTGLLGLDTNQSVAYQIFTLLLAMLLLALFASRWQRLNLRVTRRLPRFGTVGVPLKYKLWVENPKTRPAIGWQIGEDLRLAYPTWAEFRSLAQRVYDLAKGPIHARQLFYPRWFRYVAQQHRATSQPQTLPPLSPQECTEVCLQLIPQQRGVLRLQGIRVTSPDPLGLAQTSRTLALPQNLLVLPKRYQVPTVELSGHRRHQSGGLAISSAVGDSQEFRSLREYRPEDSPRKLHWKSWAKVGKPMVKEEQDEYFVRHALILDTFVSDTFVASGVTANRDIQAGELDATEQFEERFEEAVSVAASFACSLSTQESLLDLLFVGLTAHGLSEGRGTATSEPLLEVLAAVQPCRDAEFSALIPVVMNRAEHLSGCICVLLAWDAVRQELVQRLEQMGVPVLALVLQTEAEISSAQMSSTMSNVHFLTLGQIQAGLMLL